MRTPMLLALLISTAAWSQDVVKVFSDKGNFFLRSDKKNPVAVGTEVPMFSDAAGQKAAGTAIVMEVTGALARITLDEEATKANARFARLAAAGPTPKMVTPTPAPAAAEKAPSNLPALKGRLSSGLRVVINNDSDVSWTECELRFDDGRTYDLGEMASNSEDTVITLKFKSPPRPPEPLYDHVLVTCDEGETKFLFSNPRSPGTLKGYAENMGGGRVDIHNTGDVTWQRCDVRKPDKTHYVMAKLKPRDSETIRSGAFNKDAEAKAPDATELALKCKQGLMKISLK
ncbi:MAG: hypothetical protein H6Q89_356 [Myxococcaceae bacterium]|nr:hypothetical protein [Myxococcaceae bacterium]